MDRAGRLPRHPWVLLNPFHCDSLFRVHIEHLPDEILGIGG